MRSLTYFMNKNEVFPNSHKAVNASEWVDKEILRMNKNGGSAFRKEMGDSVAIYTDKKPVTPNHIWE